MADKHRVVGVGVGLLALLYLAVWFRLDGRVDALGEEITRLQGELAWMNQIPGFDPSHTQASGLSSLTGYVEETAREYGLVEAISRIEPEGNTRVSLRLQDAPFGRVLDWIHLSTGEQNLMISRLTVARQDADGQVHIELTLERADR